MHGSPPTEEGVFCNLHLSNILLNLPDEIIELIFFDLDFADRCKMRGVNKRLYGIEGRMKKPLENRRKIVISGVSRTSSDLNIIIGNRKEKVSLDEALLLIHRFANIFKFRSVVFSPSQKEHLKLLNWMNEINSDVFRIPFSEHDSNHLSHHFDRSIVCNFMHNAEIVKILRVCATVKAEDLLFIKEIAQANSRFCGIGLRIPRKTARDFVKNILKEEKKMKGRSWAAARNEGSFLTMVLRDYGNVYKFGLYNSECEEKYPMLHPYDLYDDFECDSETESEYKGEDSFYE